MDVKDVNVVYLELHARCSQNHSRGLTAAREGRHLVNGADVPGNQAKLPSTIFLWQWLLALVIVLLTWCCE